MDIIRFYLFQHIWPGARVGILAATRVPHLPMQRQRGHAVWSDWASFSIINLIFKHCTVKCLKIEQQNQSFSTSCDRRQPARSNSLPSTVCLQAAGRSNFWSLHAHTRLQPAAFWLACDLHVNRQNVTWSPFPQNGKVKWFQIADWASSILNLENKVSRPKFRPRSSKFRSSKSIARTIKSTNWVQ